ncbi:MAG: RNase adapter RapZ [Rhodobacteraceae bacterium]|nr:RNase adapter RapZ [Paracoccaceae bacterium]
MASDDKKPNVVLVTGPSGAGRSTAINAFEDAGFETIDSMPIALLPRLLGGPSPHQPMALGIDVRTRDFSPVKVLELLDTIAELPEFESALLFLDCSMEVLLRRYSETRRRHPLSPDETPLKGIEREKELLAPLRNRADVLVDTSDFTPHDLKSEIAGSFLEEKANSLAVSVQSFSYKRGVPRGIDMVLDCRFLNNPYWDESLRAKTGCDQEVVDFVATDARHADFLTHLLGMIRWLLPEYRKEGKAHFGVGLGCTGGQHRSVAVAEKVAKALAADGWRVSIRHRELERQQST